MRRIVISLIIAAACSASPALAQQTTFMNSQGEYLGSMWTQNNQSTFFNSQGEYAGNAIRYPNGITTYMDNSGNYLGSAQTSPPLD